VPDRVYESSGVRILECAIDGPPLRTDRDAVDLISAAAGANAEWAVVPVSRFDPEFWILRTRLAGDFFQKFVTYGKRIVILGEIPAEFSQSRALHDFVVECNRGRQIWFVKNLDEFRDRLPGQ
jgi:Domain of unknown function (DUF4180)